MFSVNLTGLESTVFWGCCTSFPASIYWLERMVFLSQPVSYIRGRGVERGKRKKPLGSSIASNRAAKKGYTSPMLFYLLIKTNS